MEAWVWSLLPSPQVLVRVIDEVGARGIEDVQSHSVFERLSLVRHVRGNAENLARMDHDLLAVNPELQRTVEDVSQLLVVMAVLRDNASFLQQHARQHDFLANHKLTLQERLEIF